MARLLGIHGLLVLILAAGLVSGCGTDRTDAIRSVRAVTTDGESVYAVVHRFDTRLMVIKRDGDTNPIWERGIGSSHAGAVHGDQLLVVETEPAGREAGTPLTPDALLEIDRETGETLRSTRVGNTVGGPDLVIDGQLWLLSYEDMTFSIVNLETMEVIETVDLEIGQIPGGPVRGPRGAENPVRIGGHVYFEVDNPTAIVKYSIERRQVEDVLPAKHMRILWPLEVHDGQLWIPQNDNERRDARSWWAHRVDPESLEIVETVTFLESPIWSLTTDHYIFDQTAIAEITQIDRATGEVVQIINGRRPKFVLDGHLWMANLERVKIG